jgi:uroporphyrinogen decarboxylase
MHGLFGLPRDLMGLVAQSTMYYTDPKLIRDVNDHLTSLFLAVLEEVCARVDLDFVYFWEDLAFKNGPLISPWLFDEFVVPYYKQLTGFLRERGVNVICVDTDGDFRLLIPGFLEGGVTGFYPFEVMAGMDVVAVRKEYPRLHIQGGLDKTKLAAGTAAIDAELEAKLPYMLSRGGYIPYCDHLVPPDVSWENFSYYRMRLREYVERHPIAR